MNPDIIFHYPQRACIETGEDENLDNIYERQHGQLCIHRSIRANLMRFNNRDEKDV